jgi:hypothetical protein
MEFLASYAFVLLGSSKSWSRKLLAAEVPLVAGLVPAGAGEQCADAADQLAERTAVRARASPDARRGPTRASFGPKHIRILASLLA